MTGLQRDGLMMVLNQLMSVRNISIEGTMLPSIIISLNLMQAKLK